MKHMRNTHHQILATLALVLSGTAFASGNHAGGHGDGHEESAIGKPGVSSKVIRIIKIDMDDTMRYTPTNLQVKQGETVRLIIQNNGQVKHEMSLGTEKELLEHLEVMKKFPEMEHDEPGKVSLAPGKQGEIVWQFTKAGTVHFGCLMPGHYEGGMKGTIKVSKK